MRDLKNYNIRYLTPIAVGKDGEQMIKEAKRESSQAYEIGYCFLPLNNKGL